MRYLSTKEAKNLYKAFLAIKTEKEYQKFLGDLLTPAEIKEFAARWQVAQMLDKKIDYKKIEAKTGMSSTTIARISKWLHGKLGGYRLMLERMQTIKNASHHTRFLAA